MTTQNKLKETLNSLQEIGFCKRPAWHDSVDSTSSHLKREVQLSDVTSKKWPDFVGATRQVAGRGTGGKNWHSGDGNLTISFWIPSNELPDNAPYLLGVFTGIVLLKTLRELVSADVLLKWPNDLLIEGGKVAGILVETASATNLPSSVNSDQIVRTDGFIVGVGLNVDSSPERDVVGQPTTCVNHHRATALGHFDCLLEFARQWVANREIWNSIGQVFFHENFRSATKFDQHLLRVETGEVVRIGRFSSLSPIGELKLTNVSNPEVEYLIRPDEIRSIGLLAE